MNKKVSVVILNWNGRKWLEQFLPSVIRNSPEQIAQIVVADNGSTDDSLEYVSTHYQQVLLIKLDKNYGFAGGYNRAIAQIQTPYTVLLNSDVEVTPGWLDAPLQALEKNEHVAAVQPKLLAYRHNNLFEYAGAAGGFLDKYGFPFCRGRVLETIEADKGQYNQPCEVLWASGAALFIRTALYRNCGGLDEYFFAHQEEIDLCWRLRNLGYQIVCTPDSVVYHVGGGTLEMEHPHKTYLNMRNNLLMIYKNIDRSALQKVMFVRFIFDYLIALRFVLKGYWPNAKAVFRARRDFHKARKQYKEFILKHSANRQNTDGVILDKSIVIESMWKGKTTFSQLMNTIPLRDDK